jgi:NAD(P)-dependent dehydrogenase (short-subunit alcohol dehydrogenase family)
MPVAIITGGSSGIGRATALALADAGHDIGITTRTNQAGAEETCAAVRAGDRRAAWRHLDLGEPEQAAAVVDSLADELGGLDVLVNNAGLNSRVPALDEPVAAFRHILDVNLTGAFACAQAAARRMAAAGHGGRIVNVTSVLAHAPLVGAASYCAAKAGLELVTQVLALEWAEYGIAVNAVAPGHTATPMNFVEPDPDPARIPRPDIPIGRPAYAQEIAEAIVFLASPRAAYATGSSLTVDGGLLLVAGPTVLERAHPNEPASPDVR